MADPLATYTFLPWLRQGIASRIEQEDTLGAASPLVERAGVTVSFDVNAQPVSNNVQLVGPGDVIGINPHAVVRTEPRRWVTDFEPNYLSFIEFYDEDFPWRYTPARATSQHRLRPWISLIVLEEGEFERLGVQPGLLSAIRLQGEAAALFPPPDQAWAWAHVHVSKDVTNESAHSPAQAVDALENLLRQNPDEALSRLVCPRRLEPNTPYFGFVVPAFETGRLAGLGLDTSATDALQSSWGAGQTDFPVYYEWAFGTGERGDFEFLVNLLEPRPVDDRVGIRDMDVQEPNFGIRGMSDPPVMGLEGALRKPGAVSRPSSWPPTPAPALLNDLEDKVNLQEDLLEDPGPGGAHPDPIVSPPLYGRWHAMVRRMSAAASGWVNELNRDPRLRVPSGFGTSVVQTNQEDYMKRAWQQLGDVLEANQRIRQAQFSITASHSIYRGSLLPLEDDQLIAATQAVHARVLGSPETIHQLVRQSRLPAAALSPAFRRIVRPRGVVARKAMPGNGRRPANLQSQLNEGRITAAPPKTAPEGQISLNDAVDQLVPGWVPRWLLRYSRWILLALILVLLLLIVATGFGALTGMLAAATLAFGIGSELLRPRAAAAEALREEGLTSESVEAVPPRPDFVISEPGAPAGPGAGAAPGTDSQEAANFRVAVADLHRRFEVPLPAPPVRAPLDFSAVSLSLIEALNPVRAIPMRMLSFVAIPASFKYLRPVETIVPVMAHPSFSDPMYAPLRDISTELLIPNLDLIPENTISLMETNRPFIEAYMIGINHEMSRELLWREYPTDMRGSYFRQFWDVSELLNRDPTKSAEEFEEENLDVTPYHTWGRSTALGTHENRPLPTGSEPGEARLVLVIRGQLLKKYPTVVIFAQKARWGKDEHDRDVRLLDESDPEGNIREPLFKAEIDPDLRFLGFNLTASEARGSPDIDDADPGWFFVIQERPGEPRFGLDLPGEDTPEIPTEWNDLAWSHLESFGPVSRIDVSVTPATNIDDEPDASVEWGSNSADMAYILYQVPVMVAFHADDMLD